ncbi:MAG: hypothetical protein ACK46Y_12730 [Fluviicola sp.]|jgi:hypothetical protein
MRKLLHFTFAALFVLGINSCGSEPKKPEIEKEVLDPNSALNMDFEGKIFSIPSPMQTALLMEEVNAPFNASILNDISSVESYNTDYQRALNLGIYGTDLGYLSVYKKNSDALRYLSTVEKLTNKLGLEGAFDKNFITRFEKNSTNKDSMMVIVADAFKKSDSYLKSNNRKEISALILIGGWIESLYLACEINKAKADVKIIERIGEQKETLNTIIEILKNYNKKNSYDDLIAEMESLQGFFNQIEVSYDFAQPKTDAKKKLTTLQHNMVVRLDNNLLNFIYQKITSIRSSII